MDTLCLILAIIGAINWGLVGFARFDLVAWIFGGQTAGVSRVIYAVVGIAGLWCITMLFRKKAARRHKKRLPCHEGASFFIRSPPRLPWEGSLFFSVGCSGRCIGS